LLKQGGSKKRIEGQPYTGGDSKLGSILNYSFSFRCHGTAGEDNANYGKLLKFMEKK
jgi:hypothetical protein